MTALDWLVIGAFTVALIMLAARVFTDRQTDDNTDD